MINSPLVSIIIAAKNSEKTIEKSVQSVLNLQYKNFELILANDGSSDSTGMLMNKYAVNKNVIVITTEGAGPSEARNAAVRKAAGDYIAFTDGDCIVDRFWIDELLKGFEMQMIASSGIAAVGGDQKSPEDDTQFGKLVQGFMKSVGFVTGYVKSSAGSKDNKPKIYPVSHNPTCNVMYRKEIFNQHAGFLKGLWPGEDVEFDYRIKRSGYAIMYNPDAVVYHYRVNNIKKFVRMMVNYGKVQAVLVKMYGLFRKIHYVPVLLAVLALSLWVLYAYNPGLAILLKLSAVLGVLLYFAVKEHKFDLTLKFFVLFFITLISWIAGFCIGIFTKIRTE